MSLRRTNMAVTLVSCLVIEACAYVLPASRIITSVTANNLRSAVPLDISRRTLLRKRASTQSVQRTMCRYETGPGESQRFPIPGSDDTWLALPKIYVLLFNPRTENEGICTYFAHSM